MPEEQARAIMSRIINQPPGRIPPSGQAPAPHIRQTHPTWGVWGQGERDRSDGGRWGGGRGGIWVWGSRTPPQRGEDRQEVTERGEMTEPAAE